MTSPTLPTPLVSPEQLVAALAAGAAPLIVDCSFDLADPGAGERAFEQGHLPGAIYAHLDRDLAGAKTGRNGRHPLPARADWAMTLARLGVTPARAVVLYDAQGGMYAARAWWMSLWAGHRSVSVLDGGLGAWKAVGGALEIGAAVPAPAPSAYPLGESLVTTIDADALLKSLGRVTLLDARAGERYRGEVEPLDKRAGHIPGARSRFFKDNLDARGRFKPAADLRARLRGLRRGARAGRAPVRLGRHGVPQPAGDGGGGDGGVGALSGLVERVVVGSGAAGGGRLKAVERG